MRLYNTLARAKEEFSPINPPAAGLYTCGPTVYHYAHIGNFRTYIFEDILKRALTACGWRVRHVMNITDVGHLVSDADDGEDKMEIGARREGKTAWDIAEFYAKAFFADFESLNCLRADVECKATAHIPEMISLVQKLEAGGYTYRTSDGIYFDTSRFGAYHKLAGKTHIEGIKAGARIGQNEEKRNASDFALWKFSPAGQKRQMEWASPWGTGFPGWHIECSAMAMKYLGETLDIHCGGIDHVAVHHTNEIAQSEAATGKEFARFWVHGEFLLAKDSVKMAKSSGEFLTLKVVTDKGYSPLDYRYLCLGAHYRTQLEFSWESMDYAAKSLANLRGILAALGQPAEAAAHESAGLTDFKSKFMAAVQDDMNMPAALSVLWEGLRGNVLLPVEKLVFARYADAILGLDLFKTPERAALPSELEAAIAEREEARKRRDFAKADSLRKFLEANGVVLKDTSAGPVWSWNPKK